MMTRMKFLILSIVIAQAFTLSIPENGTNTTNVTITNNQTETKTNVTIIQPTPVQVVQIVQPAPVQVIDVVQTVPVYDVVAVTPVVDVITDVTPVAISYTPVLYTFPTEYTLYSAEIDVVVNDQPDYVTRKSTGKARAENEVNLIAEMKALKKELFGKEKYSTKDLREKKSAYNPKWLNTQLKVSRMLAIEDLLKNEKSK